MPKLAGRCLCRAIRYECLGEVEEVIYCHCESCRRQTSSPVAVFVMVKASALRFADSMPKEYNSSPGVWRSFCPNCGSPIGYRSDRRPDIVDLFVGTHDDPDSVRPWCHVETSEQIAWFDVHDHLPRFERGRRGATPIRHGPREQ
jgi:hypothetical protein